MALMIDTVFNQNPEIRWLECPRTQAQFLTELHGVMNDRYDVPTGGDGIVYVGGGKFWPGIVVGCKMLRDLGCKLPIQVWYRGTCEPIVPRQVDGLGVELIDADEMSELLQDNRVPRGHLGLGGWEAKGYALSHTKFTRFAYLDADAYFVNDPTPLFEAIPGKAVGYWSDLPHCEENVHWNKVWPNGKNGVPSFQGGQFIFDRRYGERALQVMAWMCQNSDFFFKHMFGDQDCWRVALSATGVPYEHFGPADWPGHAFVCRWGGKDWVVHRCQGKLFKPTDIPKKASHFSNPQGHLPAERKVFGFLAEVLNDEDVDGSIFDCHYDQELWGNADSGHGSTPGESEGYVSAVNAIRVMNKWDSCVDIGCGDGRVAARLGFPRYSGFDASESALRQFARNAPGLVAQKLDAFRDLDSIPAADVLLCRDVLHHWPNKWIVDWLRRIKANPRWKAVILAQDRYQGEDGQDTYVGGYRALDAQWRPLNEFGLLKLADYIHKAIYLMPL